VNLQVAIKDNLNSRTAVSLV